MPRIFLSINSILFMGFGVYAALNAPTLAQNLGVQDISQSGLHEIRSNYGGVNFGIGLMCLFAAVRTQWQRPALMLLLAYTGGYVLGRLFSVPIDGVPSIRFIGFGVFEFIVAGISALLLRR